MSDSKENIRNLSLENLILITEEIGEKKFRAKQVFEWIWSKGANSFEGMGNVPKKLLIHLEENYFFDALHISDEQKSSDKTIKCAFKNLRQLYY